jgi:c-di-GMP-binding flagellar brake protein YcgR
MPELWDDDRRLPRGSYIIPCLLRDTDTEVLVKAVLLDISATGCRVFTNDRRVRNMSDQVLKGRSFQVEFDFYNVKTDGIQGTVANVHPGRDPKQERQLGLKFTKIEPTTGRDINRLVTRDRERLKKLRPKGSPGQA